MKQEQIKERVIIVIAERADYDIAEVKENTNLSEDLGMDSLEKMCLLMDLENEFSITIHDEAVEKANTVSDCIAIVEQSLAKE